MSPLPSYPFICKINACILTITTLPHLAFAQMPGGNTPSVLVSPVTTGFDTVERRSIGHTESIRTVSVQTAVQGYLQKIHIENGAYVQKGDILFEVDPTRYEAEVQKIKATITELEARISYTEKHLIRLKQLADMQATSEEELERYIHEREELKALMLEAEAMLTLAEKNLSDCTIRAAITGRVGRIQNAVGNYVDYAAQLASIKQIDPIYVKFPLSQNDMEGVFHGHHGIKDVTHIHLRAADGFILPNQGKISIIDSQLHEETDSYTLWAEFSNSEGQLADSGVGEVIISLNTRQEVGMLPLTAVQYDSTGAFVYVLDADNKVTRRQVSVGNTQGMNQTIYDGVQEGEIVIIDGAHKVREGSRVNPKMQAGVSSDSNSKPTLNDTLPPVAAQVESPRLIEDPTILISHGARLEEVRQVAITPKIEGTLEKIAFLEGAEVKQGDVLFVIDQTRYAAAVKAQEAKITQINVQIKEADRKWQRQIYLFDRAATSLNEVDTAKLAYDRLLAQKLSAEAQLTIALDDLSRCTIEAPIDGIIGRISYPEGSYIKDDYELATLLQVRPMYARFALSETDILSYFGSAEKMKKEVELTLIGASGKRYESTGDIEFIDNVIQPTTGTQNCWAVFHNPDGILKSGAVVTIEVKRKPEFKQLGIPSEAIMADSHGHYVYLLQHGRAVKTPIVSGATNAEGVTVVYKGLSPDDEVICSNFTELSHGAKVSIAR